MILEVPVGRVDRLIDAIQVRAARDPIAPRTRRHAGGGSCAASLRGCCTTTLCRSGGGWSWSCATLTTLLLCRQGQRHCCRHHRRHECACKPVTHVPRSPLKLFAASIKVLAGVSRKPSTPTGRLQPPPPAPASYREPPLPCAGRDRSRWTP